MLRRVALRGASALRARALQLPALSRQSTLLQPLALARSLGGRMSREDERRFDGDGMYTKAEFIEYYGEDKGYEHWTAVEHFAHQLTNRIKRSNSVGHVLDLHHEYQVAFDHIHVGATWISLGRLMKRDRKPLARWEEELRGPP